MSALEKGELSIGISLKPNFAYMVSAGTNLVFDSSQRRFAPNAFPFLTMVPINTLPILRPRYFGSTAIFASSYSLSPVLMSAQVPAISSLTVAKIIVPPSFKMCESG